MKSEEPSNQEPAGNLEIKTNEEGSKREGYGQLSQSRSAVFITVIIIFIVNLLAILSILLLDDIQETGPFLSDSQIILSAVIDLFLGINLLRGKSWARFFMLLRCGAGILIWGVISVIQGDFGGLILNTGILLAFILLLTGNSTRLRMAAGVALAVVTFIGGMTISIIIPSTNLPTVPATTTIPESFSTYTGEGFFSISYPEDWTPLMSVIEEAEQEMKQYSEDVGIGSQVNEMQIVFYGGKLTEDDSFVFVMVTIEPKSLWPIGTLVENTHQWSIENVDQYVEHSRDKTMIGKRNAIIQIYQGCNVESRLIGSTTAYVVGDKFLWTVLCGCDNNELDSNLYTFDQIVRSLRIEY